MSYLLDTCTVSYIIKNSYPKLRENLSSHFESDLAISTITQGELIHGLKKNPSKKLEQALEGFFELIHILSFDSVCAFTYGKMRANYEKKGIDHGRHPSMLPLFYWSEHINQRKSDQLFCLVL